MQNVMIVMCAKRFHLKNTPKKRHDCACSNPASHSEVLSSDLCSETTYLTVPLHAFHRPVKAYAREIP